MCVCYSARQSGVGLPQSVDNFNYVVLLSDGLMASVIAEMKLNEMKIM